MTAIFADVPEETKHRLDRLQAARQYSDALRLVIIDAIDLLDAQVFKDEDGRNFVTAAIRYRYDLKEGNQ